MSYVSENTLAVDLTLNTSQWRRLIAIDDPGTRKNFVLKVWSGLGLYPEPAQDRVVEALCSGAHSIFNEDPLSEGFEKTPKLRAKGSILFDGAWASIKGDEIKWRGYEPDKEGFFAVGRSLAFSVINFEEEIERRIDDFVGKHEQNPTTMVVGWRWGDVFESHFRQAISILPKELREMREKKYNDVSVTSFISSVGEIKIIVDPNADSEHFSLLVDNEKSIRQARIKEKARGIFTQ